MGLGRQVSGLGETLVSTESLLTGVFPPLASRDDLKGLLRQLSAENKTLRETIKQNNIVFKHHHEKLVAWQEEMAAADEKQLEKFQQTRTLIHEIKKENQELKNKL